MKRAIKKLKQGETSDDEQATSQDEQSEDEQIGTSNEAPSATSESIGEDHRDKIRELEVLVKLGSKTLKAGEEVGRGAGEGSARGVDGRAQLCCGG